MSVAAERSRTPEGVWVPQKPVTIEQLFTGNFPERNIWSMSEPNIKDVYNSFARKPLIPFVKKFADTTDLLVVCPPVQGKDLQRLFHFAKPSNAFDIDYADTQQDWRELYEQGNEKLLEAHRRIPNWSLFEPYRLSILEFIKNDIDRQARDTDMFVPVMHMTQTAQGSEWNLEELTDEEIALVHTAPGIHADTQPLSILGPLYMAVFSPTITASWGTDLNFKLQNKGRNTQDMGSTQVFVLSLAKADTLLESDVKKKLFDYAKEGTYKPYYKHVTLSGVSPDTLLALGLPDESLASSSIWFVSHHGVRYTGWHINNHSKGPYILLTSDDKDYEDFSNVQSIIASVTTGVVEEDITSRDNYDIVNIIRLPIKVTHEDLIRLIEKYAEHFREAKLLNVFYKNLPVDVVNSPSLANERIEAS